MTTQIALSDSTKTTQACRLTSVSCFVVTRRRHTEKWNAHNFANYDSNPYYVSIINVYPHNMHRRASLVGCYWASVLLQKLLEFLYWFRQTVAPISAISLQVRSICSCLVNKLIAQNGHADCAMRWPEVICHSLHIHTNYSIFVRNIYILLPDNWYQSIIDTAYYLPVL